MEWCPEWYAYYEAATVLAVHPWQLAGFEYDRPSDMPICWREWAFDLVRCRAILRQQHQQSLNDLFR